MRIPKTFTVDDALLTYVTRTRRGRSTSQRVNELLRSAILQERYQELEKEAAEFFAQPLRRTRRDQAEAKAFQRAALKSIARD